MDATLKAMTLRRIDAELTGTPFLQNKGDPAELYAQVLAQYTAHRQAYIDAVAQETETLNKARNDLASAQQVLKKLQDTVPIYRQQAAAQLRLAKEGFMSELAAKDKERERIEKEQDLKAQDAAVAGIVKDLATHTRGTVVQPGTILMTLVPLDEPLAADVQAKNEDIGFVRPGHRPVIGPRRPRPARHHRKKTGRKARKLRKSGNRKDFMTPVGYEFLRRTFGLSAFAPRRPALVRPVTRLEPTDEALLVPPTVAPDSVDPLLHVLFALKHEGVNLQILAEALPRIEAGAMAAAIRHAPTGAYARLACYLWEAFTGRELADLPAVGGPYVSLFDPDRYVTGPEVRSSRWRVAFNGLGTLAYCATVERTPAIAEGMRSDILARTKAFVDALGVGMTDRALAWAYLHETESSFEIEREAPSDEKARAFVALLHQAHEGRPLSEDYLVELQNAALTNPYNAAAAFRTEQNWLQGPGRGAAAVSYVPPPPDLARELMEELMRWANDASRALDPIIAASVISFAFVLIHPFMDGNGRLSRFLFHHALCQSGRLEKGLILPVSVAMKRNEAEYLRTLQSFSKPARERWAIRWADEGEYLLQFKGTPALYRFWDATACVEFGFRMAAQALEIELREETEYLVRFDRVARAVDERFDLRGSDLATLVNSALASGGVVSKHRRKQFGGRVPSDAFDFIEAKVQKALAEEASTSAAAPAPSRRRPRSR